MSQTFFRLHAPRSEERLSWEEGKVGFLGVSCPSNANHNRAGRRKNNLSVIVPVKKLVDINWTWFSECVISRPAHESFLSEGFTGFLTKPVTSRFSDGKSIPGLTELVVTGWAGIAPLASGVKLHESKTLRCCNRLAYTKVTDPTKLIDENQWDRSDFFMVWPLPKFIFVSERVAKFFERQKLRIATLTSVEELTFTKTNLADDFLAPGRLSDWMPEARAHELGDPSGIY